MSGIDDPVAGACALLDDLPDAGLSAEAAYDLLERQGLGDGLPVCAAELSRVAALTDQVGDVAPSISIPPLRGELTPRRLAVCAALAGCQPVHVPVVAGAVRALIDPALNAYGLLTTTGSAALMTVVNGPVRRTAGFNAGTNCLGPGNRANATVGRCLSLVVRILGGAREGVADMATLGQPAKYTCCFAEHEEASPWPPLHVERGVEPSRSSVTVVGMSGIVEIFESDSANPSDMVAALVPGLVAAPILPQLPGLIGGGRPMVILTPEWAANFAVAGLSKTDVKRELYGAARRPDDPDARVALLPDDIVVVVAGGPGLKQAVVPNWNGGSQPVTVPLARESTI